MARSRRPETRLGSGVRRRRLAPAIAILVGLALLALAGGWLAHHRHGRPRAAAAARAPTSTRHGAEERRERAFRRLVAREAGVAHAGARGRLVALTFDDGPGPYTGAVVRELRRLRAPATFFVIGFQLHWYRPLLRRMARDGFAIEDHTWHHPDLRRLSNAQVRQEIVRTRRAVRRLTGALTRLVRPPDGGLDRRVLTDIARAGMATILWSVDTADWSRPGTRAIIRRVVSGARPGAIILMHDGGGDRAQTVAAVPVIVRALRARGYRLVTVPTLLAEAPPPPDALNHGRSLAGD